MAEPKAFVVAPTLDAFLSALTLCDALLIPTPGAVYAPPTPIAKDNKATPYGLYAISGGARGEVALTHPGTERLEKTVIGLHDDVPGRLANVVGEWKMFRKVDVPNEGISEIAFHHQKKVVNGDTLYYPITATSARALANGVEIIPIREKEWIQMKKDAGDLFPYGTLAKFMNTVTFTRHVRGDLIRVQNRAVFEQDVVNKGVLQCTDLIDVFPLLNEHSIHAVTRGLSNQENLSVTMMMYLYSWRVPSLKNLGDAAPPKSGLKTEQKDAAERFARDEVKCGLLYWAPGVGKTLGAWNCVIELVKKTTPATLGIYFTSSALFLAETKFVQELESNIPLFVGVEVGAVTKTVVTEFPSDDDAQRKPAPVPLGWASEFTLTIAGRDTRVRVFSTIHRRFSRTAASYHLGGRHFEEQFLAPRECEVVVNIVDEAHGFRTISEKMIRDAKKQELAKEEQAEWTKNLAGWKKTKSGLAAFGPGESVTVADTWCMLPKDVEYTRVFWEALRFDSRFVPKREGKVESEQRKTLLLTATPIGNRSTHLRNILACGLYAANAEIPGGTDDDFEIGGHDDGDDTDGEDVPPDRAEDDGDDDTDTVGTMRGSDVSTSAPSRVGRRAKLRQSIETIIDDASFFVSSANVDPVTAPHQNFTSCHMYIRESGNIIGPGREQPWLEKDIMDKTFLSANEDLKAVHELWTQYSSDSRSSESEEKDEVGMFYRVDENGAWALLGLTDASVSDKASQKKPIETFAEHLHRIVMSCQNTTSRPSRKHVPQYLMTRVGSDAAEDESLIEAISDQVMSETLRAYSPKYEALLFVIEKILDSDAAARTKSATPMMMFFENVSKHIFSLQSLEGFKMYVSLRNRRRANDAGHAYYAYDLDDKGRAIEFVLPWNDANTSRKSEIDALVETWLKFVCAGSDTRPALPEDMCVAEYLYFYSKVESEIKGAVLDGEEVDGELYSEEDTFFVEPIRRRLFRFFGVVAPTDRDHIVFSVTGDGSHARDWASYLCDERTGLYNHPLNRNGRLVRILAGSKMIAESNDFRNTRHMIFTYPETDTVSMLQKFGRIARSSDDSKYPYYRWGFDERVHRGYQPIVNYISLINKRAWDSNRKNLKNKMSFHNAYSRLLVKDKDDEGAALWESLKTKEWPGYVKTEMAKLGL